MQREMPFFQELKQAEYIDSRHVEQFETYREAVMYCWKNRRKGKGMVERLDQALCASIIGIHAPHFSRCVNAKTKSPMDLKTDLVPAFEAYTGNRAVTQYLSRITATTSLEEIQAARAA